MSFNLILSPTATFTNHNPNARVITRGWLKSMFMRGVFNVKHPTT